MTTEHPFFWGLSTILFLLYTFLLKTMKKVLIYLIYLWVKYHRISRWLDYALQAHGAGGANRTLNDRHLHRLHCYHPLGGFLLALLYRLSRERIYIFFHTNLFRQPIFFLLILNVFCYRCFVSSYSRRTWKFKFGTMRSTILCISLETPFDLLLLL